MYMWRVIFLHYTETTKVLYEATKHWKRRGIHGKISKSFVYHIENNIIMFQKCIMLFEDIYNCIVTYVSLYWWMTKELYPVIVRSKLIDLCIWCTPFILQTDAVYDIGIVFKTQL